MRVIVTGSRDWMDFEIVYDAPDALLPGHRGITVVHGACPTGADLYASMWVNTCSVPEVIEEPHPADWAAHGRRAGPIRNEAMIKAGADLVLAFPLPGGRGTQHTIRLAREAGIPVRIWGSDE